MKMKDKITRCLSLVICFVLIAATALMMTSCGKDKKSGNDNTASSMSVSEKKEIGNGAVSFELTVEDKTGKTFYTVKTDEKTVGDALVKSKIATAKDGMILKLNGVTADYNVDKTYWAFYVDGSYAQKGAFETEIEKDKSYMFKVEG